MRIESGVWATVDRNGSTLERSERFSPLCFMVTWESNGIEMRRLFAHTERDEAYHFASRLRRNARVESYLAVEFELVESTNIEIVEVNHGKRI